jgi:hypothetical protein
MPRPALLPAIALVLALALSACADDTGPPSSAPTGPTATPNESNTLGLRQCDLLTAAEAGGVLGREVTADPYAENNGATAICRYSAGGRFVAFIRVEERTTQPVPSGVPEDVVEDLGDTAVWVNFVSTLRIFDGDWIIDVGFEEASDGTREQAVGLAEIVLPRLP